MAHLGEFGAALRELDFDERDTFDFFGERFTTIDVMVPMLMFQLAASVTGKVEETEGMGALWQAWRISLGDAEFNRFYKVAIDSRADNESLVAVAMALFSAQAGRPTQRQPDSTAGLPSTSPSSSSSSSHPAFGHLRRVDEVLTG